MRSVSNFSGLIFLLIISLCSCGDDKKENVKKPAPVLIKGLYSFGPEAALFIDCSTGKEYWTADSSAKLELQYTQLAIGKPYESVYIEVEGDIKPSGKEGPASAYDSTLTVRKVISIKKDIPNDICK
jgi:copper homeostasis protein (lipoprotein)